MFSLFFFFSLKVSELINIDLILLHSDTNRVSFDSPVGGHLSISGNTALSPMHVLSTFVKDNSVGDICVYFFMLFVSLILFSPIKCCVFLNYKINNKDIR